MKNILKRIFSISMVMILSIGMQPFIVSAANSVTITISDKTANVGDEVSVKVNLSTSDTIATTDIYLQYDSNILELKPDNSNVYGGGGNIHILSTESTSFTVKFNTIRAGSSKISVTSDSKVINANLNYLTINSGTGSVTASVPANVTYSSNNSLTSLSISPGTLSPAFSPDTTSYTATVGSDCAALVVSAPAQDSTAKVSVAGKSMDPGMNTTTITVTAEDGSVKKYVIKTTKNTAEVTPTVANNAVAATKAANETEVQTSPAAEVSTTVYGLKYKVVSDFANHPLPDGYSATDMDYNGQKITAGKGANGLTIVYLEKADGSGEGNFYVYDKASNSFSLLCIVTQPTLTYTILPITSSMEIPDNYTKSNLTINGNNVDILIPNGSNVKYCLFYAVDSTGKAGWYRYDYAEQTAQKYYGDDLVNEALAPVSQQSDSAKMWKIVASASVLASFILLIAVIVLTVKVKSKKTDSYEDNDNDDDDGEDIFNLIAHRELASDQTVENDEQYNNNLSDDELGVNKLDIDELSEQEDNNLEIASEIGIDAAVTQEINFKEDDYEFNPEELLEDDKFKSDSEALSEEDDQDNDISDMKDILDDDVDEDSEDDINSDDDDDFEFLDIEDLDYK